MVSAKKEYRLWACLNNITSIIEVSECCKAFGLSQDEEDRAMSLWDHKRTMRRVRRA